MSFVHVTKIAPKGTYLRRILANCYNTSAENNIDPTENLSDCEDEVLAKRNKSRLRTTDRDFLHGNPSPINPMHWSHGTVSYYRKSYGRYGSASGVDPQFCWPTDAELEEKIEYEKVAYPKSISEQLIDVHTKKIEKLKSVLARQEVVVKNVEQINTWKQNLLDKISKKEREINAAKQRKERLMEEVRAHFGYTVDPKDEKFKEMVEKKEKEQKKLAKEAKKKAREEEMIARLLSKKTPIVAADAAENKEAKPENS